MYSWFVDNYPEIIELERAGKRGYIAGKGTGRKKKEGVPRNVTAEHRARTA
jgi:ribosome modulation factor